MKFLEKVEDYLGLKDEPIEIKDFAETGEIFREKRSEELDSIEKKSSKYREKVEEAVEDLEKDFKRLQGFEDVKERAIIEDNIENFVDKRLRLLEDFSSSKDIEKLESGLENLLDEFNSMTEKRRQVLEEANINSEFSGSLAKLTETHKELKDFLENRYRTRKRLEKIEDAASKIQNLREEKEKVQEEKNEKEISNLKKRLEEKKKEIEELKNSQLSEDFNKKKEKIEELKKERESILNSIDRAMGRMERGLKKMLHEEKIGKTSRESSKILRNIRDGEKKEILQKEPEKVEEAAESLEKSIEGDFLGSSTRQSLVQGVNYFRKFTEKKKKLNRKQERIRDLQEEIDSHAYQEKKKKLEKDKEEIERKLEEGKSDLNELENREDRLEQEIQEKETKIKQKLEEEFNGKISIKSD